MRVIVLGNQKGGPGKTTTTANLAAAMGEQGHQVLAVDADPQAQLGEAFDVWAETGRSLGELLDPPTGGGPTIDEVIWKAVAPGVDLLPADLHPLERAEKALDSQPLRGPAALRELLQTISDRYDYVLVDTPPRLTALTIAALVAADFAIAVAKPKALSFNGVRAFAAKVEDVAESPFNPRLRLLGVVLNEFDPRPEETGVILGALEDEGLPVLATRIPGSYLASKAVLLRAPAVLAYPKSLVADAYRALAGEVLDRLALVEV